MKLVYIKTGFSVFTHHKEIDDGCRRNRLQSRVHTGTLSIYGK